MADEKKDGDMEFLDSMFPSTEQLESSLTKEDKEGIEKTQELEKELEDFRNDLSGGESTDTEKTDDKLSHEGDNSSSPSVVSLLALSLREKGIMQSFTEEELKALKSEEELLDKIVEDRNKHFKSTLNERQLKYVEALENEIPEEEIKQDLVAEEAYNSIKDEDVEEEPNLQKQLVFNDLVSKGINQDKAKRMIEAAEKAGTLVDEAKESLKSLQVQSKEAITKKINDAKEREAKKVEDSKKEVEKLRSDILNAKEIIPGYELSPQIKEKIFESMTKAVEVDKETKKPLNIIDVDKKKDPIEFEKRLHLMYHLTNGFKDFSQVTQKEKTKATIQLKNALEREEYKSSKPQSPLSAEVNEMLESMRKEGLK